jgi:hypothetical protein
MIIPAFAKVVPNTNAAIIVPAATILFTFFISLFS